MMIMDVLQVMIVNKPYVVMADAKQENILEIALKTVNSFASHLLQARFLVLMVIMFLVVQIHLDVQD